MRISGLVVVALLGAAAPSGGTAQAPRAPHLTDATFGGSLWVPKGFRVTEYAKVSRARFMALGPTGAVYVSQSRDGQVVRLLDADGDGAAELQQVVVSGLDRPHGLAVRDGWLYIANTDALVRVKLDATGAASGSPETLTTYSGGDGHWTRTIIFGADGAIYVAIGSSCNVCVEKNADRATVMRYDAQGRNGRIFSSGLRNAVGLALHPVTGAIWATQNERDNLAPDHEDLPSDEINILADGADYGWPYCHDDRVPNPEFNDAARCRSTVPPAFPLQAHSAPLGMTFLDKASAFPAEYRGDALVAYHGSWNRRTPTGTKVVRLRIKDGRPVGVEDFIVGWQDGGTKRLGRPVDVLVAKDGSVLVSDDASGTIYRVARSTR